MLELQPLPDTVSICRLDPGAPLPDEPPGASFWAAVRTATELSLVVPEGTEPASAKADPGWRVLRVVEAHSLEVTGVTASLAAPLAEIGVPIFTLATFDTDHVLVQVDRFEEAIARLRAVGHRIEDLA
jgi:hypothetical protein